MSEFDTFGEYGRSHEPRERPPLERTYMPSGLRTTDSTRCPACGGRPLLTGSLGNASWLRCSRCDREFLAPRVTAELPAVGDLATEDRHVFFRLGFGRDPVVIVPAGKDWKFHVRAALKRGTPWRKVWLIDGPDMTLLPLSEPRRTPAPSQARRPSTSRKRLNPDEDDLEDLIREYAAAVVAFRGVCDDLRRVGEPSSRADKTPEGETLKLLGVQLWETVYPSLTTKAACEAFWSRLPAGSYARWQAKELARELEF